MAQYRSEENDVTEGFCVGKESDILKVTVDPRETPTDAHPAFQHEDSQKPEVPDTPIASPVGSPTKTARASYLDEDGQEEAMKEVFQNDWSSRSSLSRPSVETLVKYGSLLVGAAGVIMVLVAKSEEWGADDSGASGSSQGSSRLLSESSGNHRRLGAGPPQLLEMVAYCLTAAGICAFFVNLLKQPLILGYLLAGVLVGPVVLDIVPSIDKVQDFSSLGLTFLLFLVGLELNVAELLKMGPVVLLTGFCQFPLTVGIHLGIFMGLDSMGIDFGPGKSVLYVALGCGISSTMIVAKILSERSDMDSPTGRLTIGILIFQDIWAIIVLVIQPDLADPQPMKLLEQFGKIAILITVALIYAKFVMHHVFAMVSDNVELMLVISLCWCFFVASFAILPFMGQSLELASLIAGVVLATFPYVAEFNGKIKFVRDFFITIFFVGLGMQIPSPELEPILTAALVAVVVLLVRWIGIFSLVMLSGGGNRLAVIATLNLSEISEFALVICSLGMGFEHVEKDTLTILIWVFAMLAILSANMLPLNYQIYNNMCSIARKIRGQKDDGHEHGEHDGHGHEKRDIVFLGFHKIAAMLVYQMWKANSPILHRMHVVDYNEQVIPQIRNKGVTASYGDISSPDVLEHCVHGEAKVVLCTIMDQLLRGTSNLQIMSVAKKVWPDCKVVALADSPLAADKLYDAGADYVIDSSQICADSYADALKALTGSWFGHGDEMVNHAHTHHTRRHSAGEAPKKRSTTSQISF